MEATQEGLPLERVGAGIHEEDEKCGDNGGETQRGVKENTEDREGIIEGGFPSGRVSHAQASSPSQPCIQPVVP